MRLEELRRASHATWEAMAPGWDERRDWVWEVSRVVGEQMVARLDPQPGESILELAAGAGDTGFAALKRAGGGCRLVCSDFSPSMVDVARRRAGELGLGDVDFRVLDAERLELPDDSVDAVLCRWGYMLMADQAAAFAETRRVLRPGGRLVYSVWGVPDRNPWVAVPARVLIERGHMQPPEPGLPGIFSMATPERNEELVRGAGFATLEIEEVAMRWRFGDFEEYWTFLLELAGVIAVVIHGLPRDTRASVRAAVEEAVEPMRAAGGYELPGLCLNVLAR